MNVQNTINVSFLFSIFQLDCWLVTLDWPFLTITNTLEAELYVCGNFCFETNDSSLAASSNIVFLWTQYIAILFHYNILQLNQSQVIHH